VKGGYVHNELLVAPVARAFERQDWQVDYEVPVRLDAGIGFIDLVAERHGWCICVEAECSAKRVGRDLDKAQAYGANELWIVTPNTRVAAAVRRSLDRMFVLPDRGGLYVLTQGEALQRVKQCLRLFAAA